MSIHEPVGDHILDMLEQAACQEAKSMEPELLKFLAENPERWMGAIAILATVIGLDETFQEEMVTERVSRCSMLGATMHHLSIHISQTPIGRVALDRLGKEIGDEPS